MERCYKCRKDVEPVVTEQVFSNGKVHLRGECPRCRKFIRFVPWVKYGLRPNPNNDSDDDIPDMYEGVGPYDIQSDSDIFELMQLKDSWE